LNAGSFFEIHFAGFGLGMVGAENFQPLRMMSIRSAIAGAENFQPLHIVILKKINGK